MDSPGRPAPPPILFLAIDAIPYDVAHELWSDGALAGFRKPRPMIAVFPSLTNVAVPSLIEASFKTRPFGYEARYIDPTTGKTGGGFSDDEGDDALAPFHGRPRGLFTHLVVYFIRRPLAYAQTRWITRQFQSDGGPWLGYVSATDGVAHFGGRDGLSRSLRDIFSAVVAMRREHAERTGVEPDVVLCSDHGMAFGRFRHLSSTDLAARLTAAGHRVCHDLHDGAVLLPLGDVGAGSIYTRGGDAAELAHLVAGAAGVDLAFGRVGDGCICFARRPPGNRMVSARIRWQRDGNRHRYRYQRIDGDPLGYARVFDRLAAERRLDDGWADDRALFDASWSHAYPDALARVHHALSDLVRVPAEVLFSMRDTYTYGPPLTHLGATLMGGQLATHGALSSAQSTGFATCTFSEDPWNGAALRPRDVFAPWHDLVRVGSATPAAR